ncbi:hypothetical protein G8V03_06725 [Clostridium botulinum D/C]|uniref:hypothetical protein n=1 Tax=Clostridium botulinum TaxID=1491 RepID=UPI001E2CC816|nr:hypothetical protein [Clostridium botulinum]MCD3350629.1 hypothetical protein [Clostridium botulinum D/C]MCD3359649.1 hypothetical protein [Clostridium botulinum D/C]MCD3363157.1 hypothetical protein [Clostridium botulinum D/C]MCD3365346.1 hypothetical protein [Clostridium botulinum D/C]
MDKKELISSHIFIFPFRWDYINNRNCFDDCIDNRLNVEKFIESLDENKWIKKEDTITNNLEYNQYTYFYDNVRDAIYGKKILEEYKFDWKYKFKNSIYSFTKRTMTKDDLQIVYNYKYTGKFSKYGINVKKEKDYYKEYSLDIRDIKLKIYDTGVAVLSYFLDNYEYKNPEDILNINDYGRRIYPQYYPLDKVKNSFLATELTITLDKDIIENFNYDGYNNPTKISKTIMHLLGSKFKCIKQEVKKDDIFINPVIDDRMFVICMYINNTIADILTQYRKNMHLRNEFWYKYIFVDNNFPTCQDEDMSEKLLKSSTYTRWKNYGTLFGISRYSFVGIKEMPDKNGENDFLINHFNTLYYEMVLLALIQRASVLRFSDEVSKIAQLDNDKALEKTKQLQKYYLWFVTKLYFSEVTAQEQGIELYDKLIAMMRIKEDVEKLDKKIEEANNYAASISSQKTNNLLNIVTFVGVAISVMTLVATLIPVLENKDLKKLLELKQVIKLFTYQYLPFACTIVLIGILKKFCNNSKLLKCSFVFMIVIAIVGQFLIKLYFK